MGKKKKNNFQKWLAYMKKYPPGKTQVPAASSKDSGKVLTVDNNGEMAWADPQGGGSGLPDITDSDKGKVLAVNNSGDPAWDLPRPWVFDPMAK